MRGGTVVTMVALVALVALIALVALVARKYMNKGSAVAFWRKRG